jgi:hypothetical protein
MNPQAGAEAVQMTLAGRPISGSSNAPARTMIRSGRLSASLNKGVPHFGQKRRRMTLPLSAVLMYSLVSPDIVKLSVPKIALTDALPEDRYWQSLHQHARVAIGSWSNWNRTAPQKHLPVTRFAIPWPSLIAAAESNDPGCADNPLSAAAVRPDLLRLAVKYVTNPRASGGMPPDGFPLSKSG